MAKSHGPKKGSGPSNKIGNSLVALSSAAVLSVYAAGYFRTRAAADRFNVEAAERRPAIPGPATAGARGQAPPPSADEARSVGAAVPAATANPTRVTETPAVPAAAALKSVAGAPVSGTASGEHSTSPAAIPNVAPAAAPIDTTTAPTASALPAPAPLVASPTVALPIAAATVGLAAAPAKPLYKDGTFLGWGTCRHGDIQASVVIEGGRIKSATIAQCLTRYSCSWIAALPPEVAVRQSPEVDYVSGATQSTNAFYYAVIEALNLSKAK